MSRSARGLKFQVDLFGRRQWLGGHGQFDNLAHFLEPPSSAVFALKPTIPESGFILVHQQLHLLTSGIFHKFEYSLRG